MSDQLSFASLVVEDGPLVGEDAANSQSAVSQSARPQSAVPQSAVLQSNPAQLAPMLRQYLELKQQYPDYLLLFQVGDFYELFFEDAKLAAEALSIRLTSRDRNNPNPVPMCGVPIHAIETYLGKLLAAGYRCVLNSQVDESRSVKENGLGEAKESNGQVTGKGSGKGMVRREISRIVTPGVRFDSDGLEDQQYNFLASVIVGPRGNGAIAYADVSTSLLRLQEVESLDECLEALERLRPREIVVPSAIAGIPVRQNESWTRQIRRLGKEFGAHVFVRPFELVSLKNVEARLSRMISASAEPALASAGSDELARLHQESLAVLDVLLSYLEEISFNHRSTLSSFKIDKPQQVLLIDAATRRNLELQFTRLDGERRNSLISHLDQTKTAMGSRCLQEWILAPSTDRAEICQRQDAVAELMQNEPGLAEITASLAGVRDLDRLSTRVICGRASPYDLRMLGESLRYISRVLQALQGSNSPLLVALRDCSDALTDVSARLVGALVEEAPSRINEGGIFQSGFSSQLDELREVRNQGKQWLLDLETKERLNSGIGGLKVKYNSVFGYFIEITKANLSKIPPHFERRQTLANAERFVTPELKKLEVTLLSSKDRQVDLERSLFEELREWVSRQVPRIQVTSRALSVIDTLASFARVAQQRNYLRPTILEGSRTKIVGGRHPVVENVLGAHNFVANATDLSVGERSFALLTGPNMGGKSTYLRQVGIIQLLAQAGSFVPADSAELGIVDRIFTRIGGADDITRGDSTFMVEMREASTILKRATSRSLVLIDEIGRGTATTDGLAIASAIAEALLDRIGCQTVFATHFHELVELVQSHAGAYSISVGVIEQGGEIVFTHRIEEGPAARSYGIEVARLAGLPESVLQRATTLLDVLDIKALQSSGVVKQGGLREQVVKTVIPNELRELAYAVKALDLNRMTPLEALLELERLKRSLGEVIV